MKKIIMGFVAASFLTAVAVPAFAGDAPAKAKPEKKEKKKADKP